VWNVYLLPEVRSWLEELDYESKKQVAAAVIVLKRLGPQLGRPLVDTLAVTRPKTTQTGTRKISHWPRRDSLCI
jgi:hypothetical protein